MKNPYRRLSSAAEPCSLPPCDRVDSPVLSSAAASVSAALGKGPIGFGWIESADPVVAGSAEAAEALRWCGLRIERRVALGGGSWGLLVVGPEQEVKRACRLVARNDPALRPAWAFKMSDGAIPVLPRIASASIEPDVHMLVSLIDAQGASLRVDLLKSLAAAGANLLHAVRSPSNVAPVAHLSGLISSAGAAAVEVMHKFGQLLPGRPGASVQVRVEKQGDAADGAGQVVSVARALHAAASAGGSSPDGVQHFVALLDHRPGALLPLIEGVAPHVSADVSLQAGLSKPVAGQPQFAAVMLGVRNRSEAQRSAIESCIDALARRFSPHAPARSAWLLPA